jgi:hypothetical protein
VDTNVLSATSPEAGAFKRADFVHWLRENPERLYVSTVTAAEFINGIARLRRIGAFRRAIALETWLEDVLRAYGNRVVPLDIPAARMTGALIDLATANGRPVGFADLSIAGIALANDLTVLTRNLRHFAPLGVPAHDPYASRPA